MYKDKKWILLFNTNYLIYNIKINRRFNSVLATVINYLPIFTNQKIKNIMGLLDDYSGIGMTPRPRAKHQDIILNICYGLKDDGYFCRPEFCVDASNLNSPAPDIVIYDDDERYPVIIIEVTNTKEVKQITAKVIELLQAYKQIKEAFVYDYEKQQWLSFGGNTSLEDPSYSYVIKEDLNDYI